VAHYLHPATVEWCLAEFAALERRLPRGA